MSDKRQDVGAIVRDVISSGAEYTITDKGEPVAVIVPVGKLNKIRAEIAERSVDE